MIFAFDDYQLDTHDWRLRRGADEIRIQRKAFEVLRYLLEHRDRPVPREELLERVWAGDVVTPAVLTVAVSKARQAIGQLGAEDGPIRTEHGRGYRFMGTVRALERAAASAGEQVAAPRVEGDAVGELFVGRDAVLSKLGDALSLAQAGHGQLRLLAGEPGVGKTRTAEELTRLAARRGVEAWWGRSHEDAAQPAFWPVVQVLRRCLGVVSPETLRRELGAGYDELAKLLPELAAPGAGEAPGLAVEDAAARFRVFDAVTRVLELVSTEQTRLVVFDDLHWGDMPSLELLGYVAPELAELRLLVVGTARTTELPPGHAARAGLDVLTRHRHFQQIELGPLTREDVARCTTEILGREIPEVSAAIYARSEGNAFFMTEALRSIGTPGAAGSPLVPSDAALDIVRRRMRALQPASLALLELAAVIGRNFELALLTEVSGQSGAEVLRALEAPLAAHLVRQREREPHRFAFGHGLIRETLYGDLPLSERARLHLAIAQALEARADAGAAERPDEIAHHYLRALPHPYVDRVLYHARRAARAAARVSAHEAAARQYARALRALEYAPPDVIAAERVPLLLALAEEDRLAGLTALALQVYGRALEAARHKGAPDALALAAIGLRSCQAMRAVPDPVAEQALTEALMVLPDGEVALRARVLARLSGQRSLETRRLMSARAAELAAGVDDPVVRHDVLLARLHATQGPDALAERLELADQILAFAGEHGEPHWRFEALLARFDVMLRRGKMPEADRELDACGALAEQLRHPAMQNDVERLRLQRRLGDGDLPGIDRELADLSQRAARLQLPFALFYYFAQSSKLFYDRGVDPNLPTSSRVYLETFPWAADNSRALIAAGLMQHGHVEAAREHYRAYADTAFAEVNRGEDFLSVIAHLGLAAVELGTPAELEQLLGMLEPHADQNIVNSSLLYYGSAAYHVGCMAARLDRTADAKAQLERAIEENRAMGAVAPLARSLIAFVPFAGRGGKALAREALELAVPRGMELLARLARELC